MIVKKLFFALPFLFFFFLFSQSLQGFLNRPELIFSLEITVLLQALFSVFLLLIFLMYSLLFFTIFVTLSRQWQYIVPPILLAACFPFVLSTPPISLILSFGLLFSLMLSAFLLRTELSSRINFHPTTLLSPITQATTLVVLVASLAYYQSFAITTNQPRFEIPVSLIDFGLKLIPTPTTGVTSKQTTIPPELLENLKKNPQLLNQIGIDPAILEQINKPQGESINQQDIIRAALYQQLQTYINPYLKYIPLVFALFFFFIQELFVYILILPVLFSLWFIFLILKITHFTHYETETREVKKLVV